MSLLRLRGVTKLFDGFVANDDVDLEVERGEVVGLLGANGAGKTTAMRQALGLIEPSAGEVRQFGEVPSKATRRRIGYVPQGLGLWGDLSVEENLVFAAEAYGSRSERPDGDLAAVGKSLVRDLSLGQQRKVAFVAALQHDPELLVLDEPTSGVDALSRSRLWDTIRSNSEAGAGVLVSTHFMDEARQCDRLLVMHRGRVVLSGTYDRIVGERTVVQVDSSRWANVFTTLSDAGFACGLAGASVRVLTEDLAAVRDALETSGIEVRLSESPATLEETMVEVSREGHAES